MGDKNRNDGDDSKAKDKDNNTTGTVGAHLGDVTTPKIPPLSSSRSIIDDHALEVTKQMSWPARSTKDLLGVHLIDNALWG